MTKEDIVSYLKSHKNYFKEKYQISKIILFGSYSREEEKDDSDIDIAIETPVSDYFLLYDLKDELEKIFNKKIDLVRLRNKMNSVFKNRINKEGVHV